MQNLATAYEYDVFLSYKRGFLIESWVTNYLLKYFEDWLREKLLARGETSPPRLFFDKRNIRPGDPWPNDLQRAVRTSKVLLAICSPSYFHSSWCLSEWESFKQRQQIQGKKLIIPVRHNDSEQFLKEIAWADFYGFTFLASDFYQSAQAISFEQKVEELAEVVAAAITAAPPFQPDWPCVDAEPRADAIPTMQRL